MADRPELMAIGDSIYNGTRSLATNAELARLSGPAQVARAFGWDFKSPAFRDSKPIWVRNWRLNNVPLQGFSHKGGLYGLDNLHPTTVGYAVLAQTVCEKIAATEGIEPVQPIDFEAAFDADSLLTNVPPLLDIDNLLIDLVVAFVRAATRPSV